MIKDEKPYEGQHLHGKEKEDEQKKKDAEKNTLGHRLENKEVSKKPSWWSK